MYSLLFMEESAATFPAFQLRSLVAANISTGNIRRAFRGKAEVTVANQKNTLTENHEAAPAF